MSVLKTDLYPYLQKYGSHCMAYSSLEEGMEYFLLEDVGYIAYISFRHPFWSWKERKVVLADPMCDETAYPEIVKTFIQKYQDVIFVQASNKLAAVLDNLGYQVNQFGVETELGVQDYHVNGKQRSKLRQWRNKCQREEVEVKEISVSNYKNHDEIRTLSNQWLAKKGGKEFSFLTRPFHYKDEKDARYFWAFKNDKLVAFAVFDPVYADEKIIGYYHNVDRISDDAPHGVSAFIILKAMEVFKQENAQFVSLGMSPLYQLGKQYNYNKFTRDALRYTFDNLNFIYPFQGNASHKKKFFGEKKSVFFCSTRGNRLWEVFVMMKSIGMF